MLNFLRQYWTSWGKYCWFFFICIICLTVIVKMCCISCWILVFFAMLLIMTFVSTLMLVICGRIRVWRNISCKSGKVFIPNKCVVSAFEFQLKSHRQNNCRGGSWKTLFALAVPRKFFCWRNQTNLCICFGSSLGCLWRLLRQCCFMKLTTIKSL